MVLLCNGFLQFSVRVWPEFTNVGLAMWPAGYYLAEWALQNCNLFEGKRIVELGAGVGLTAVALEHSCKQKPVIFLTDYMNVILQNCYETMEMSTCYIDW